MNWYDSLVSWAEEHGIMAGSLIACIITTIKCYKTKGLLNSLIMGILGAMLVPMVYYALITVYPNISPSVGLSLGAGIGSFGADTIRITILHYLRHKFNDKS